MTNTTTTQHHLTPAVEAILTINLLDPAVAGAAATDMVAFIMRGRTRGDHLLIGMEALVSYAFGHIFWNGAESHPEEQAAVVTLPWE